MRRIRGWMIGENSLMCRSDAASINLSMRDPRVDCEIGVRNPESDFDSNRITENVPRMKPFRAWTCCLALTAFCLHPSFGQTEDGLASSVWRLPLADGNTQIIDLNSSREAIGFRENLLGRGNLSEESVYFGPDGMPRSIPILEGYTHTFGTALSDTGYVVGRATRPIGHPEGATQAFAWHPEEEKLQGLGFLPDDTSSVATDISTDGRRVVGYSIGKERVRPCLWEFSEESWSVIPLPVTLDDNPILAPSGVRISPDGKRIVASVSTPETIPGKRYRSHLVEWRADGDGWERRILYPEILIPAAVNDHGAVAGRYVKEGSYRPFLWDPQDGFRDLGLLPGDVNGQAYDIDNQGTVVGFSDDPAGPEGGPEAFFWRNGEMRKLQLGENVVASVAHALNGLGEVAGLLEDNEAFRTTGFVLVSVDALEKVEAEVSPETDVPVDETTDRDTD